MVRLGEDRSAIPAGFCIGFIDPSLVAEQLLGLLVGIRQGLNEFAVTWGLASVYLTIEVLLGVDLRVLVLVRASALPGGRDRFPVFGCGLLLHNIHGARTTLEVRHV